MTDHIARMFAQVVAEHGARTATRVRVGDDWQTQTYAEFGAAVHRTARALVNAGVQRGDRIALCASNSPEWSQIDLGCLAVGAIPVPIYETSSPEQIAHIVRDSGCVMMFVGTEAQAAKVAEVRDSLDSLTKLVCFVATDLDGVATLEDFSAPAADEDRLLELDELVASRLDDASGEDLASIIYTSGTTGPPKGVMLTHGALMAQVDCLDQFFSITPQDHSLCFLPLSHALERAWTTVVISHGCMNTYVSNAREVAAMLVLAKPTMMVSVPRLYEKVIATAREKAAESPVKKRIFDWAVHVGGRMQRSYRKGRQPSLFWRLQLPVADKLVLKNVREAMGGPKNVLACGGAPLRQEIEEFFSAAGLLLLQGYGLTEASPLVSFNAPDAFKFGTCGRVIAGGQLAVGADSEILYRGPNLMTGYWNNPEATEAAFQDGWLRTGDAGYVDTDGFLVITDRIKDIIVTSGGKNIAPQPIEGLVLADPLFENAVLLGDNRPYLTMLVKPSLPHITQIAEKLNISFTSPSELAENSQILEELKRRMAAVTAKLPHHEQIRDIGVLWEEFTTDNGLLTPTMKVKRREVEKRFTEVIDAMYAGLSDRRKGPKGG